MVHLKVGDIDREREVIRVEQGKGRKDRYAMLSPTLRALLRTWWCEARAKGKMLPGGWMFPGQNPLNCRNANGIDINRDFTTQSAHRHHTPN